MPNFQALTFWILILLTLTLKIKIGYPYNETEFRPDPRKKSLGCNAILVVRSRFVDKPKHSKQEVVNLLWAFRCRFCSLVLVITSIKITIKINSVFLLFVKLPYCPGRKSRRRAKGFCGRDRTV